MKNKGAPPFAGAEFDIVYNHGINKDAAQMAQTENPALAAKIVGVIIAKRGEATAGA